jgi:wyosine [tRNA(Phe)-imidazoG37] synthetase (radical SAM superfamily)
MTRDTPIAMTLRVDDHSRDSVGMTYVYPVISRRAGGVSIGINLNVNNACNWRCIYCQVPNLKRGGPPPVDMVRLEQELRTFLGEILHGNFMERCVPAQARRIVDVAFSGNGEPTSASEFTAAVGLVTGVLEDLGLADKVRIRLITNGSLMDRHTVQEGVAQIGRSGGEVWFKVDAAAPQRIAAINGTRIQAVTVERRLRRCSSLCETWVQTCMFAIDGAVPTETDIESYLGFLQRVQDVVAGVHLYGLARPPLQPGATRLSRLAAELLAEIGTRIEKTGLTVHVSP